MRACTYDIVASLHLQEDVQHAIKYIIAILLMAINMLFISQWNGATRVDDYDVINVHICTMFCTLKQYFCEHNHERNHGDAVEAVTTMS